MRFPLLVLVYTALLIAVAVELVKADSTAVVDATEEALSPVTTLAVTRRKQQTITTRRLGEGYDDDGDEFCCLERATSCEPLTEGKAHEYEYDAGGKKDGSSTVCRSYCAVPCGGDDDDDDSSFPFYHHQCFPTATKADNGCDCDCICCRPPPPVPMPMPPFRGKGYHHRGRQLNGYVQGKGQHNVPHWPMPGPHINCKCSCNHCGKKHYRDDDYY